jgi:prenylcysteine oxidase/farnesylcysteine lyase
VIDIIPIDSEDGTKFQIVTNSSIHANASVYDAVFFAAPWHLSPISKSISSFFEEQIPYVNSRMSKGQ